MDDTIEVSLSREDLAFLVGLVGATRTRPFTTKLYDKLRAAEQELGTRLQPEVFALLPLPGDAMQDGSMVLASVWSRDTEEPWLAELMLLYPEPPYYGIVQIVAHGRAWHYAHEPIRESNINSATERFAENGGDT